MNPFLNRLARLAPQNISPVGSMLQPTIGDPQQRISALSGSADAVGSDSPLSQLASNSQQPNQQTPILDQFKQLLSSYPNPANYQPSKLRQVLGGLAMGAGAGPAAYESGAALGFRNDPRVGMELSNQVLNGPYDKAVNNWMGQAKPLEAGAGIEERQLSNQRMLQQSKDLATERTEQNRIREEQYKREVERDKLAHDDKIQKMQGDVDKANQLLEEKKREADMKQGDTEAQLALRHAQMDAIDAVHKLQIAQKDRALDEAKRLHDNEKTNWDAKNAEAEARIKILEGKAAPSTQTDTTKKDIYEGGYDIPVLGHVGGKKVGTSTTTTKKPIGPTTGNIQMKGPDGKLYQVPAEKVEEAKAKGMVAAQ